MELAKQKELFDQMEFKSQQSIAQKSEEFQQQIKSFEMELAKQKELFDQVEVTAQQKLESSLQQINSLADEIIHLKSKLKETENLLSCQVTDQKNIKYKTQTMYKIKKITLFPNKNK